MSGRIKDGKMLLKAGQMMKTVVMQDMNNGHIPFKFSVAEMQSKFDCENQSQLLSFMFKSCRTCGQMTIKSLDSFLANYDHAPC